MALQTSGSITLNDIHVEAGGTTGTACSINESDIRELIDKTASTEMSFSDWYGATATFSFSISSNTLKGTLSTLATAAGWDGNDLIDCTINSGVYVWSDSTSTAALTIDVANATVTNNGYIMGQGGSGGFNTSSSSGNATDGGPAININAASTTITNNSGAFIAGGGGGGAWSVEDRPAGSFFKGGGGGAGGGEGGKGGSNNNSHRAGASSPGGTGGGGAQAGGGRYTAVNEGWGSGGGRILPGTAHSSSGYTGGGAGGQAGTGGGGGGWGAAGSNGDSFGTTIYGGSGGAAITGTSRTLTNNGTVYGST